MPMKNTRPGYITIGISHKILYRFNLMRKTVLTRSCKSEIGVCVVSQVPWEITIAGIFILPSKEVHLQSTCYHSNTKQMLRYPYNAKFKMYTLMLYVRIKMDEQNNAGQ